LEQTFMASPSAFGKRPAAVLMPIFDAPPYEVLFVERAAHLRRHAGQIAFPGGAVDDGDADHAAAALRELYEEVGIPPEAVRIIGALAVVRQERNVFAVTPFVGIVRTGTPLVVDPNEASGVHRVPLEEILRPGAIREGTHRDGERVIDTLILDHGSVRVWGLTARMLHNFVADFRREPSPLRDAIQGALGAAF
jgi:8-oxo-dGTP pyrophosphatase MutT (NUDIX family)